MENNKQYQKDEGSYYPSGGADRPFLNEADFINVLWAKSGRPIFELSEDLAAGFLLSDFDLGEWVADGTLLGHRKDTVLPARPFAAFLIRLPFAIDYFCASGFKTKLLMVSGSQDGAVVTWMWHDDKCEKDPTCQCNTGTLGPIEGGGVSDATILLVRAFLEWYSAQGEQLPAPVKPLAYSKKTRANQPTIYRLTSTIKLDSRLINHAKNPGDPQYKINARFVVRGHWRNQACGKGLQDRRTTWIAPYWKGDDTLEPIQHIYQASQSRPGC